MRNQGIKLCLGFSLLLCLVWQCASRPPHVILIKAAGFVEGQKPEGTDAITEATSFGRNVHVVTDALRSELVRLNLDADIVRFNEADKIEKIIHDQSIDLIVFAGPAYSSQFPRQLKGVVPKLENHILNEQILCTSLTTCRFMDSGRWAVTSFNDSLKLKGIHTMAGLTIHHENEDPEWKSKVRAYADKILTTIKNKRN